MCNNKTIFSCLRRFVIGFVVLCSNGLQLMALPVDFTPQAHEFVFESMKRDGIRMRHGTGWIAYLPPPNWTCTREGGLLVLRPPAAMRSARGSISHQEGSPPLPAWDQMGINTFIQRVRVFLPPSAQNVQIADVRRDPLRIGGRETYLFVFSGYMLAQKCRLMVILLPMEDEQFAFMLSAEEKEYEAAAAAFMTSLYSFHWENPTP